MADADSPLAWTLYLADNRRDILRLLAAIISHMPNPEGLRDSSSKPLSSLPFLPAVSLSTTSPIHHCFPFSEIQYVSENYGKKNLSASMRMMTRYAYKNAYLFFHTLFVYRERFILTNKTNKFQILKVCKKIDYE